MENAHPMSKQLLIAIGLSLLAGIAAFALWLATASAPPKFSITNADQTPVSVSAFSRGAVLDIGAIPPGVTVELAHDNGSALSFEITRANGTAVRTGAIHFAPGTVTQVVITRTGVDIRSGESDRR